jgi:hypothetical protein
MPLGATPGVAPLPRYAPTIVACRQGRRPPRRSADGWRVSGRAPKGEVSAPYGKGEIGATSQNGAENRVIMLRGRGTPGVTGTCAFPGRPLVGACPSRATVWPFSPSGICAPCGERRKATAYRPEKRQPPRPSPREKRQGSMLVPRTPLLGRRATAAESTGMALPCPARFLIAAAPLLALIPRMPELRRLALQRGAQIWSFTGGSASGGPPGTAHDMGNTDLQPPRLKRRTELAKNKRQMARPVVPVR